MPVALTCLFSRRHVVTAREEHLEGIVSHAAQCGWHFQTQLSPLVCPSWSAIKNGWNDGSVRLVGRRGDKADKRAKNADDPDGSLDHFVVIVDDVVLGQ